MIRKVEIRGLDGVRDLLASVKNGAPKAVARGLNRGLAKAKTVAVEEIAKEVNLKKSVIRATLSERKATYTDPRCWLQSKDRRGVPAYDKTKAWKIRNQVPGLHFGGKQLKRGYSFQFKHGRPRTHFPGAFVAIMKNGHAGIFIRRGKHRMPIKEIWSSAVPDILANQERMEPVLEAAGSAAQAEIERQVNLLLSGAAL